MPVFEVFTDELVPDDGIYLFPVAPDTFEQTVLKTEFEGADVLKQITCTNGHSPAYVLSLKKGGEPHCPVPFCRWWPGLARQRVHSGGDRL